MLLSCFSPFSNGDQRGMARFGGSCIVQRFVERGFVRNSCKSAFGPCQRTPLGCSAAEFPPGLPFLGLVSPLLILEGSLSAGGGSWVPTKMLQFAEIPWGRRPLCKLPCLDPPLLVNHLPGNNALYLLSKGTNELSVGEKKPQVFSGVAWGFLCPGKALGGFCTVNITLCTSPLRPSPTFPKGWRGRAAFLQPPGKGKMPLALAASRFLLFAGISRKHFGLMNPQPGARLFLVSDFIAK